MTPLKIRYALWLPIVGFVVGGLLAVLSIATQEYMSLALGTLVVAMAVLLLKNPSIIVDQQQVRVLNLLGSTRKTYEITGLGDLDVHDNALFQQPGDIKILQLGASLNQADVAKLKALAAS